MSLDKLLRHVRLMPRLSCFLDEALEIRAPAATGVEKCLPCNRSNSYLHSCRFGHQPLQDTQAGLWRDVSESSCRPARGRVVSQPCGHSDLAPRTPVNGESR